METPAAVIRLDRAVQRDIRRHLQGAVYTGGELSGQEMTLTFAKQGKVYDLKIVVSQAGTMGTGTPFLTPILRERN